MSFTLSRTEKPLGTPDTEVVDVVPAACHNEAETMDIER